jgi:hypothetical protein
MGGNLGHMGQKHDRTAIIPFVGISGALIPDALEYTDVLKAGYQSKRLRVAVVVKRAMW